MLTLHERLTRSERGVVFQVGGSTRKYMPPGVYRYGRSLSCSEECRGKAAGQVGLAQSMRAPLPHSGAASVSWKWGQGRVPGRGMTQFQGSISIDRE